MVMCGFEKFNPFYNKRNPQRPEAKVVREDVPHRLVHLYYRFMVALAWIFGWHIILMLEIKERLSKGPKEVKNV